MKLSIAALSIVLLQAASAIAVPEPAYVPDKCEDTLCYKMDSYPKCSERWFAALHACYAPPCNIRYVQDPAADCYNTAKT
ncbi:MAG: hypothetical protein M1823_004084 [Watsoniomyces obsoletus]|nr:MAG: hypothetical protein M1823_004084 [Watsoniomyces obsoletus]